MAEIAPRPDAPAVMRKLPERRAVTAPPPTLRFDSAGAASASSVLRLDGVEAPRVVCTGSPGDRPGPRPRPLQGPVHRQRRASRQAGAAPGAHALLGTRRRPSPRSSKRPSPRSSSGSKPAASLRRSRPGKGPRRAGRRPRSRHIPAAVRRAVYERDGGRCRYADAQGRRCTARDGLEFHHRRPFGHGGDNSVANISLACTVAQQPPGRGRLRPCGHGQTSPAEGAERPDATLFRSGHSPAE